MGIPIQIYHIINYQKNQENIPQNLIKLCVIFVKRCCNYNISVILYLVSWGISSAGRAPALHAGGQGFEPLILHQKKEDGLLTIFFLFLMWLRLEPVGRWRLTSRSCEATSSQRSVGDRLGRQGRSL